MSPLLAVHTSPERELEFKSFLRERMTARLRVGCLLAAVLVVLCVPLDFVAHPSRALFFLVVRLAVSGSALLLWVVIHRARDIERWAFPLSVLLSLTVAGGIEVMIVALGAHDTPYYAGLNLVILGVGLLFPWTMQQMLGVCASIYLMYLLPIALEHRSIGSGELVNNNYFLLLTCVVAVTSSRFSTKLRRAEFFARMDLEVREGELRQTSSQLESSVAKLQELDRMKSQFFANVSHELRTPLTLILSPLEAVLQDDEHPLAHELRDYLSSMHRNATRLLRLINNLLDLSKLEAGKVYLRYESVELSSFVASMFPPFNALARSKKLRLALEGAEVEPVQVDAEKLDTVLQNLLANALKFTPAGGSVTARVSEDATHVIVAVSDTGIGIAQKDLPIIFDRFAQADGTATRRFGGTGIGLALVKELVEVHGGTVAARSEPGVGSTFEVRLPKGEAHIRDELRERRAVDLPVVRDRRESNRDPVASLMPKAQPPEGILDWAEPPPEPESEGAVGRPRILVVEDNPDLRHFIARLLRQEFQVTEATDGDQGVALANELVPDLILSDVMMPGRSGYELTRELKSNARTSSIPIVLLTAKRGVDAALEGFSFGADDYLGKPFNSRELLARLRAQLRLRELSRQLAQAQKLSMLGTLAAGLAHEVRNPVNFIVNSVPVLRRALPPSSDPLRVAAVELLDIVEEGARRIDAIVSDLLDFSHVDAAELAPWRPAESVRTTLQLLRPRTDDLEVVLSLRGEGPVEGRPGPLNQVVMNLLDNALRAAGKGGKVEVSTESEGDGVRMTVRDDGPGIAPEHLQRIFDPFFTTRAVGQGTGLGLHLARQIIEGHGGRIEVRSRLGEGAELTFWLPTRHGERRMVDEARL